MDDPVGVLKAGLAEDECGALELIERRGVSGLLHIFTESSPALTVLGERMLREVRAKRAILAEHHEVPAKGADFSVCGTCAHVWPCPTLHHLAGIYSEQPGDLTTS